MEMQSINHGVAITGGGGTGKSHWARVIATAYAQDGHSVVWVRPWAFVEPEPLPDAVRQHRIKGLDDIGVVMSSPADLLVVDSGAEIRVSEEDAAALASQLSRAHGCRVVVVASTSA
jgi:hypothetical protein